MQLRAKNQIEQDSVEKYVSRVKFKEVRNTISRLNLSGLKVEFYSADWQRVRFNVAAD